MYKKVLSGFLLVCMVFSLSLPAFAYETDKIDANAANSAVSIEVKVAIIDILQGLEANKDKFGFGSVDFEQICIGLPIQTYQYICNTLKPSYAMYLLTENGALIAWAIKSGDSYQITTELVNEIVDIVTRGDEIAIIFDQNGCYLLVDDQMMLIKECSFKNLEYSVLDPNLFYDTSELEVTSFGQDTVLGYKSAPEAYTSSKLLLGVDFVTQKPYAYICWAATAVSVINYRLNTNYTAEYIAQKYTGSTDPNTFNVLIPTADLAKVYVQNGLDWPTLYKFGFYPDEVILPNLTADCPVIGKFDTRYSDVGHVATIYGIDVIHGYLYIMDPAVGFSTAVYSGTSKRYEYKYEGVTSYLMYGLCILHVDVDS